MKNLQTPSTPLCATINHAGNPAPCRTHSRAVLRLLFVLVAIFGLNAGQLRALALTWTSTTTSWMTSGNWFLPGPPSSTDSADFLGGGTSSVDLNNGGGGTVADTMFFNTAAPDYFIEDTYNDFNATPELMAVTTSITKSALNSVQMANLRITCPTLDVNSGVFELIGTNIATFTTANINGGIVCVMAFPPSSVSALNWNVNSGGTLKGTGVATTTPGGYSTLIGNVNVAAGGTLLAGCSPGTCNIQGNVAFAAGAQSVFELAVPNVVGGGSDLFNIDGDLTLNGTFDVVAVTGFGAGTYRLINYSGALVNNGVALGNLPVGYAAQLDFSTTNQVSLIVYSAATCCPPSNSPTVCYTNTIHPGYNFFVNSLCHGNNAPITPLPVDGTTILRWNSGTQSYVTVATYDSGAGGWVDMAFNPISAPTFAVGETFIVNSPNTSAYNWIVCGVIPVCPPPCLTNTTKLELVGGLGTNVVYWTNLSSCPPVCGTELYVWNPTNQSFTTYTYDASGWSPPFPLIGVGQSVFVKIGTYVNCNPCTNNLVINGSFENPNIGANTVAQLPTMPGWTAIGPGGPTTLEIWSGNFFSMTPQAGSQHLEINSLATNVTVSQVITNVSTNCTAKFCFWYAGRAGHTPNLFQLQIIGSGLPPVNFNPPAYTGPASWQQYCVEFTPLSTTLTIQFNGMQAFSPAGAHIDNVTLMQCCTNPPCNEPLVVNCSTNKTVECGTPWQFDPPTASSACCSTSPVVSVVATWTSGVCPKLLSRSWQVTDCFSQWLTCTQTVTVVDTAGPVISVPTLNTFYVSCTNSKVVNFVVSAYDVCSGTVSVTCNPPSGYNFPLGTTIVTCTATDPCGNTTIKTFNVTVVNTGWTWKQPWTLGKVDYCTDSNPDTTPRSTALINAHPSVNWKNFDVAARYRPFGVSFMKLPKNLTCATLEIRMKPYRKNLFAFDSVNDTITIGTPGGWTKFIGAGNANPGITNVTWLNQKGCVQVFTFDLANMPLDAANLLPLVNAANELDIYIEDSTTVDYAKLTYCYCVDGAVVSGGLDWNLSNTKFSYADGHTVFDPIDPLTNATVTAEFGGVDGFRFYPGNLNLASTSGSEFTLKTSTTSAPEGSAFRFKGETNGSVGMAMTSLASNISQIQVMLKHNGSLVSQTNLPPNPGMNSIVIMEDGVDIWCCMEDGVESIVASEKDSLTLRFSNPHLIRDCPMCPPTLADEVTIALVKSSAQPDDKLTGFTMDATGLSGIQIARSSVKLGDAWVSPTGSAAAAAGGNLSLTAFDGSSTNSIGADIELQATNRVAFAFSLEQNSNTQVPQTNAAVIVEADVNYILGTMNDGVRIKQDQSGSDTVLTPDFSALGSTVARFKIYNHGAPAADVTSANPITLSTAIAATPADDSDGIWTWEWASDGIALRLTDTKAIVINGNSYVGDEIRISPVAPTNTITSIIAIHIEATQVDELHLQPVSLPAPTWTMSPLDWDADELHIQWSGPLNGAVESAPALNGPWTLVPNQSAYSATMPSPETTNAAPAQFFRMRSN